MTDTERNEKLWQAACAALTGTLSGGVWSKPEVQARTILDYAAALVAEYERRTEGGGQ